MDNNSINIVAFIILPIIGSLFIVYACFDFMSKVDRSIYKPKIVYIISYILLTAIMMYTASIGRPIINTVTVIIGLVGAGHFLYNDSKLYLLYYSIFSICLLCVDLLVTVGISIIVNTTSIYFVNIAYYQIIVIISMRIGEYAYIKLFTTFINRRNNGKVTTLQGIKFLVLPMFSLVFIFTLIMYLQIYAGNEEILWLLVNIILILILNVYVTHIFDAISKNNTLKNELDLYYQQSNLQYQYYNNLESKYQESRKLIHDIRNHLNTIEELYNTEDTESAKAYTKDIHKMLNELNQKYYTSNRVLNIILNDKFQSIKNTSIKIDYRIGDVDLDFIKDIDITTIFANLLDNAIESAIGVKEKSYINIDIDKFNEFIVIKITNSMDKIPIRDRYRFKSNKKNHEGIGIENVKKAIEKYEGSIVVDYTENEFKVNIVIPI